MPSEKLLEEIHRMLFNFAIELIKRKYHNESSLKDIIDFVHAFTITHFQLQDDKNAKEKT